MHRHPRSWMAHSGKGKRALMARPAAAMPRTSKTPSVLVPLHKEVMRGVCAPGLRGSMRRSPPNRQAMSDGSMRPDAGGGDGCGDIASSPLKLWRVDCARASSRTVCATPPAASVPLLGSAWSSAVMRVSIASALPHGSYLAADAPEPPPPGSWVRPRSRGDGRARLRCLEVNESLERGPRAKAVKVAATR